MEQKKQNHNNWGKLRILSWTCCKVERIIKQNDSSTSDRKIHRGKVIRNELGITTIKQDTH